MRILIAALVCLFALAGFPPASQAFPDRPIKIVAPFPPAGGADIVARLIGRHVSKTLGQPVVIENRAGANGNIGSDVAAKSAPDGYTLLLNSNSLVWNQSLGRNRSFELFKDFSPIILAVETPYILVVKRSSEIKDVAALIALAKSKPGQLNCSTVGVGSALQMSAELLKSMASVDITNIPFQGGPPAVLAVVSGQVDMTFSNLLTVQPFIDSGQMRAIAVTTDKRSAALPDIPTMAEAGVPGYELSGWFGFWAPAGTPKPIIETLNRAIAAALADPEVRAYLEKEAAVVVGGTPEDFDRYIHNDYVKWDKIIKAANIRAD